jgi:hypothetical protein
LLFSFLRVPVSFSPPPPLRPKYCSVTPSISVLPSWSCVWHLLQWKVVSPPPRNHQARRPPLVGYLRLLI